MFSWFQEKGFCHTGPRLSNPGAGRAGGTKPFEIGIFPLNYAIFEIANQICVYPVSDLNSFSDNSGNVLPDVMLVKKGTLLRDFVREKIHTDLANHFMFGINAITKKRLGENYELQHNDVIKVVTSK